MTFSARHSAHSLRLTGGVAALCLFAATACSSDAGESSTTEAPASESTDAPVQTEPATTAPLATEVPVETDPATTTPPTEPSTTVAEVTRAAGFASLAPIIDGYLEDEGVSGAGLVIIDRDDGIVHEEYFGDFSADRVSLIASSSKMITAGVLLRLQDDGLLDIDAPISDVVDWGGGNPDITVAQMLSNSSGLVGLGPDPGYGPYVCQFIGADLGECAETIFASPDDDADIVPPDTEFRYGGAQWQVAGAVAEAVSGKSWAELIDEIYIQPCGVDTLGYNNHWVSLAGGGFEYPVDFDVSQLTPTDNPHMEGGAYIAAPDYAALMLMHLREGECDGGQVLSPDAVATAHSDRVGDEWGGNAGSDSADADTGYGMGWWIDRESGRVSDGGAYGSQPWLDLEDGYGVYLAFEAGGQLGGGLAELLFDPIDEAMQAAS